MKTWKSFVILSCAALGFWLIQAVVAGLLLSLPSGMKAVAQPPAESVVGRYGVATTERTGQSYVILVDTATGEVWGIQFEPGTWKRTKPSQWNSLPRK